MGIDSEDLNDRAKAANLCEGPKQDALQRGGFCSWPSSQDSLKQKGLCLVESDSVGDNDYLTWCHHSRCDPVVDFKAWPARSWGSLWAEQSQLTAQSERWGLMKAAQSQLGLEGLSSMSSDDSTRRECPSRRTSIWFILVCVLATSVMLDLRFVMAGDLSWRFDCQRSWPVLSIGPDPPAPRILLDDSAAGGTSSRIDVPRKARPRAPHLEPFDCPF